MKSDNIPRDSFEALYEISEKLHAILEPDRLLETVLEIATAHLDAERGLIILRSGAKESVVAAARNFVDDRSRDELAASSSVVRSVLEGGKPLLTFDALSDERFESSRSIVAQKILSILCVPIRLQEEVTGAIYLDTTRARGKFTDDSVKFLTVFGQLAGAAIENARRYETLRTENERLRSEVGISTLRHELIGKSRAWRSTLELVLRIVDTDASVLITGESGTGKELVARAIHENGRRKEKPFIALNCSAIPENLIESELFGYRKGAFTGAASDKVGLMEHAEGGTLFLDEVAELPMALQPKLLRAVQEREIRRVGDVADRRIDVRIISATNKDLQAEVKAGRFRDDLFFRLNVISVPVPPLRDRNEDIPLLVHHFLRKANSAHGRSVREIRKDAMDALMRHPWHGNVRELQNVIERAVVLARGEDIGVDDLQLHHYTEEDLLQSGLTLDEFERRLVEKTLAEMSGNRTKTAERLGVSLRWLQYRLKEWHRDGE